MPVTPWYVPLAGGALIGAASGLLAARLGRVAGISGMVGALLEGPASGEKADAHEARWRMAFLLGLVAAPWLFRALAFVGCMLFGMSAHTVWRRARRARLGSDDAAQAGSA